MAVRLALAFTWVDSTQFFAFLPSICSIKKKWLL